MSPAARHRGEAARGRPAGRLSRRACARPGSPSIRAAPPTFLAAARVAPMRSLADLVARRPGDARRLARRLRRSSTPSSRPGSPSDPLPQDRRIARRGAGAAGQTAAASRAGAARHPRRRCGRQGRVRRRHLSTAAASAARAKPIAPCLAGIKRDLGLLPTIKSRTHLPSAARPPHRRRAHGPRGAAHGRRDAAAVSEGAAGQAAPAAAAGRRLRLDEGAFGGDAALRAAPLARPPEGRDLLLRHAAVARHAHAEAPPAGRGAGAALRPGLRLRRRHADRRVAGRPSCRSRAMQRWCAARSRWCSPTGSSAANPTPMIHAVDAPGAAQPPPGLGDARLPPIRATGR